MTLLTILIVWAILHYSIFRPRVDGFERYYAWMTAKTSRWLALLIPLIIFAFLFHSLKYLPIIYFIVNIGILWYGWSYQEECTNGIFSKSLCSFTVVFWYVILGPLGVLLYDYMRRAHFPERNLLEWPAARALGFGYALAGHFSPTFSYWSVHLFKNIENNLFLENCGVIALHSELTAFQPLENDTRSLVKRAQIMLLLILVIFYVGMLL